MPRRRIRLGQSERSEELLGKTQIGISLKSASEQAAAAIAAMPEQPKSIRCPICGRTKPWDTLYCEQGAVILGERIYPSLRCGESSGFVVFATGDAHASFQWHAFDVLRLGARQVAVRDGSVATIYEFDDERLHWAAVDRPWVPYQPLGDQRYAILL